MTVGAGFAVKSVKVYKHKQHNMEPNRPTDKKKSQLQKCRNSKSFNASSIS